MIRCRPCTFLRFGSKLRVAVAILKVSSLRFSFVTYFLVRRIWGLSFVFSYKFQLKISCYAWFLRNFGKRWKNLGFWHCTDPKSVVCYLVSHSFFFPGDPNGRFGLLVKGSNCLLVRDGFIAFAVSTFEAISSCLFLLPISFFYFLFWKLFISA